MKKICPRGYKKMFRWNLFLTWANNGKDSFCAELILCISLPADERTAEAWTTFQSELYNDGRAAVIYDGLYLSNVELKNRGYMSELLTRPVDRTNAGVVG